MKQKYMVITLIAFALSVVTVSAGKKLIKGEEFAEIGIGNDSIVVSKVIDGDVTCYVSRHGKFGAHAISCVK